MKFCGKSDIGMQRKINQDSFKCLSLWGGEATLLIVCDGMGGHKAGEIASSRAVSAFCDKMVASPCISETPSEQLGEIRHTMISAAKAANSLIYRMSNDFDELSGMGTTLVAGLIYQNQLFCVNIGDSRLYIMTEAETRQITHDHSFVQYLLDYGKITPEEAKTYPRKNVITQAVGINPRTEADFFCVRLNYWGNGYLLHCTDGLSNYVTPEQMSKALYSAPKCEDGTTNLDLAADKLISLANAAGGADNITAVIAQF